MFSAPQKSGVVPLPGLDSLLKNYGYCCSPVFQQAVRLPGPRTRILVAVSGGLDSMVLLHVLKAAARAKRFTLAVAHFNHRLRGSASDGDEAFVRKTAASLKLPFYSAAADIKQLASREKISMEMAARQLRHRFLAETAKAKRMNRIALAHHADDQVELFFLRLLRGSGGTGLAGMQWRSLSPVDPRISLIRPLLDLPKEALEQFARQNKIRFRNDATNVSVDILRNRVRHELLPLLRKHYQPGLDKTVLRVMKIAGAEADLVSGLAEDWLQRRGILRRAKTTSSAPPLQTEFETLPEAIQRRVIKIQLIELSIKPDFELVERLRCSVNIGVTVTANLSVSRDAMGKVNRQELRVPASVGQTVTVELNKPGRLLFGGAELEWRVRRGPVSFHRGAKPCGGREFFDADKVGDVVLLRHWRAGDRFKPLGMASTVKLQDLFINAKVPRERRHELVVAQGSSGIFWVEGLRMAEDFKVTPRTKRILLWQWRRKNS